MSSRALVPIIVLLLGLGAGGCLPDTAGPRDEAENPYFVRGVARKKSLDHKGAVEAFEKALEVNPRSALAHFELGLLYQDQEGDCATAIYHYNQVLKLRPNHEHPSDLARIRIPACKQELIKTDALATINPAALRDLERFRDENALLRKQLDQAHAQLATRPPFITNTVYLTNRTPVSLPHGLDLRVSIRPGGAADPGARAGSNAGPARPLRTHKVRPGESFTAIARQYNVRLEALLAANPNIEPKKLRAGHTLTVPAP